MNQKHLLEDVKKLGLILVLSVVIVQVFFSKESIITTIRFILSVAWISIIPGYALLLPWREKFSFPEYGTVAAFLGLALVGTLSYHLGLLGITLSLQPIILPLILLMIGLGIEWKVKHETTSTPPR